MQTRSVFPSTSVIKQIDSYYLNMLHVLGKGSCGQIVLSYDQHHDMFLAIKVIALDNLTDPKSLDYLKSEIKNMQLAKHPNVVRLYDVRRSQKNIYLVMEYCEGGNLEKYVYDRGGRLSERETLRILRKIIKGYKYLHSLGIVHRDLKLANILTNHGEVKIADLGYSKLMENFTNDFLISRVGTMLYMSPQILEAMHYTNKTDVWSLGILYYQMVFGRSPWNVQGVDGSKQTVKNFLKNIRENGLIFPKDVRVSETTKNLLQEMLMYDEDDRLSWEEIFKEGFLQEESNNSSMEIEGEEEYFVKNRILENVYECEKTIAVHLETNKKIESGKMPQLKMVGSIDSQDFSTNGSQGTDKKDIQEIFARKALEDNERVISSRVFRFLMQKRNKIVFYLALAQEITVAYPKKPEISSVFLEFIFRGFNKLKNLKRLEKMFPKEEIEVFMKGRQKEVFESFIEMENELIQVIVSKQGVSEPGKRKKKDFLVFLADLFKKMGEDKNNIVSTANKIIMALNIEREFKGRKILNLDFNKIYEEVR